MALCLAAAATLAWRMPLATAILILASTLLNWANGPLARTHDQYTIFGSGLDWLAELLAQIVMLAWLGSLAPAWLPLLIGVAAIELALGLFDFATAATGRYPVFAGRSGFGIILEWSKPGGSSTMFGTVLRLAYPLFLIACCLDLSWPARAEWTGMVLRGSEIVLAAPALLYICCELASLMFVLACWREAPRQAPHISFDDGPAGVQYLGLLPAEQQALLLRAWEQSMITIAGEWRASLERKEVFWVNLWQRSGGGEKLAIACIEEVDRRARQLTALHYDTSVVELGGYGLIANPVGSSTQTWHIDYALDYSTIFIPLTEISPENALQYAVLPASLARDAYQQATANLDVVDLAALVRAGEWVSVRQLLAKPFSMIKMDFGTIHRGIANTGGYDRVLFWVSVQKRGALLSYEPLVAVIHE